MLYQLVKFGRYLAQHPLQLLTLGLSVSAMTVRPSHSQMVSEPCQNNQLRFFNKAPNQLEQALKEKVILDRFLSADEAEKIDTKKIIGTILNTTLVFPDALPMIEHVVYDPRTTFICTTLENIKRAGGLSLSAINSGFETYFNDQELTPYLVRHEIHHGYSYMRHILSEPDRDRALLPFPATTNNIKNYKMFLRNGEKQISKFKDLWLKEKSGQKLPRSEAKELAAYQEVVKNLPIFPIKMYIPTHAYEELISKNAHVGGHYTKDFVEYKITQLHLINKQQAIFEYQPVEPAAMLFYIIEKTHKMLNNPDYRHKSDISLLVEHDAYIFSCLDRATALKFFGEAVRMVDKDINHYHNQIARSTCSP